MPITSTVVTLLIFTIIVVAHEFGHFIVARKNGILVEEFAVGLGPKLIGWQPGETLFTLRLIPLGGYCKMLDGDEENINNPRAYNSKKVWQRMAVCFAGVTMNFLLAVVLGSIIISTTSINTTTITHVLPNTPAEAAGFLPGDRLVRIDGRRVRSFQDIGRFINMSGAQQIDIVVRRDGALQTIPVTPRYEAAFDSYMLGISPVRAGFLSPRRAYLPVAGPIQTLGGGLELSVYSVRLVLDGLSMLINRQVDVGDMAGPLGIGQAINHNLQAAAATEAPARSMFLSSVYIAMLLSANLAVLNLLPIPALDGGRLIFLIIEGVRRKPLPPEKEGWIHFAGFVLVLGLAVLITFNDILRIIGAQ